MNRMIMINGPFHSYFPRMSLSLNKKYSCKQNRETFYNAFHNPFRHRCVKLVYYRNKPSLSIALVMLNWYKSIIQDPVWRQCPDERTHRTGQFLSFTINFHLTATFSAEAVVPVNDWLTGTVTPSENIQGQVKYRCQLFKDFKDF